MKTTKQRGNAKQIHRPIAEISRELIEGASPDTIANSEGMRRQTFVTHLNRMGYEPVQCWRLRRFADGTFVDEIK